MYCPKCGAQNDDESRSCDKCGQDLSSAASGGVLLGSADVTELEVVRQELQDEYDILEELGRGGMAIVFRAREKELDREVAIKVLPFSLAFDKEFVERFQREARTAARLEHPSIIPIYRVGRSGRAIYFVMKLLRGKSLAAVLARGAIPPADIRHMLGEVGRALAYAHKSGIVHRDIKPDNIMYDEHGLAVVTDFGIAKAASGGRLTGTGMAIGTPHYMSPEQARAQPIDGRSDLYSLGVVAYQCLTGELPFDGEDSFSIGYKHIMEDIPVPHLLSADQKNLFEIVKQMMAKRPEERFQRADDLVEALESGAPYMASGITTAATRAMPGVSRERMASAPTTPLPGLPGGRTGAHVPARRSVLAGVLTWVLIVGSVLGGGAYFAVSRGLLAPLLSSGDAVVSDEDLPLGDSAGLDTLGTVTGPVARDSSGPKLVPPGTPGHLSLANVPQGARVLINGQLVRGTEIDLPPGTHVLTVHATGYRPYERQVVITPGNPSAVRVELELVGDGTPGGGGPCEQYGPEYNRDNACFDTRPTPLSATVIPLPADIPVVPRQAILLIRVSREGRTLETRLYGPSNVETFNTQAMDMARVLRWTPATKNGQPAEAWVQWPFRPVRQ